MNDETVPTHQRHAPTHYQVLDVAPTADQAAIRRAYHQAARRWHPDRLGQLSAEDAKRAEVEIRRVNQAWEVLGREDRRREYDRQVRAGEVPAQGARPAGVRSDDGVIRIDPRLLDPEFLAARRHAQFDEISHVHSIVLRAVPLLAVVGLLGAIFVFSAYARSDQGVAAPTTVAGPSLGEGIDANDCVSVLTGPALLARPCGDGADGRVIGARIDGIDGSVCPLGTSREVRLSNGVVACLAPVR
jgi:DnaJ-domain-containing protein 1